MATHTHQIDPADNHLPPLELPAGALDASHPEYENTTGSDPPEIEPVEHRVRLDIIEAGGLMTYEEYGPTPLARKYIQKTLVDTYESERRFFPTYDRLEDYLADAPAFLTGELESQYEELEKIREGRRRWYTEQIPKNLDTIQKTAAKTLHPVTTNTLHGVVIVDSNTDPREYADEHGLDRDDVIRETQLDNHIMPSAYGITLPAPLLVGEFASGSTYAFLPWSDAVVCGCPYKQTNKWTVMCKHELAAASRLGNAQEDSLDAKYVLPVDVGVKVPLRARRFVSPTVAATHTPRRPR